MRNCLLIIVLFLSACSAAEEVDEGPIRAELASLGQEFSAAYMRGDINTMMGLYTVDAVLLPPGRENIQGTENLRNYWTLGDGQVITRHAMTATELEIDGNLASEYGTYVIAGENDGTAWGPNYGKYMLLWKQNEDGRWRMKLDMWASRPAPEE